MGQPATTNSTVTKLTGALRAELLLLQAMLDQQGHELTTVRRALQSERAATGALKRDRAAEIKAVREEEAGKWRDLLSDLKARYWTAVAPLCIQRFFIAYISCITSNDRIIIRECVQKFPDWPPGPTTANGTPLCL
jgi:hypothetical protein